MYRAFNVKLDDNSFKSYSANYEMYKSEKTSSKKVLEQLIASQDTVSASEIKNILLPQKSYDIFLSHSHKDIDLALRVKNYLETVFRLTVFIDSVYWDNIDELQEILNKYHLDSETNLYNHQKTMQIAQHSNMILGSALTEMIDCCECVFFLNTNNSIANKYDIVTGRSTTYSPWIYHEVYTTTVIKIKPPKRIEPVLEHRDNALMYNKNIPQIEYGLNLDKMELLNQEKLNMWHDAFLKQHKLNSLEILYNLIKYRN